MSNAMDDHADGELGSMAWGATPADHRVNGSRSRAMFTHEGAHHRRWTLTPCDGGQYPD
jgi:hypothetical protein